MGGGRPYALCALAAVLLAASAVDATADDLSCCLDLEQRIAELESVTARKANRTVTLQISGLVNTAIMGWDDGAERNAYVVTNDNQRSRFSFVGKAAIDAVWEAGYAIDIGLRAANSKLVNQVTDSDHILRRDFDVRSSVW